jgi:hypothetical protein
MRSRLIELISFTEVQNDLSAVVKGVFEVDEVVQEITNSVKNDVLRKCFRDPHGLLWFWCFFLDVGNGSLLTPSFKCLSEVTADT